MANNDKDKALQNALAAVRAARVSGATSYAEADKRLAEARRDFERREHADDN